MLHVGLQMTAPNYGKRSFIKHLNNRCSQSYKWVRFAKINIYFILGGRLADRFHEVTVSGIWSLISNSAVSQLKRLLIISTMLSTFPVKVMSESALLNIFCNKKFRTWDWFLVGLIILGLDQSQPVYCSGQSPLARHGITINRSRPSLLCYPNHRLWRTENN